MSKEFSPTSQLQRAAIYSGGMAGGVGLALLILFGLFDGGIERRLYANCVRAYQDSPICLTEHPASRLAEQPSPSKTP